MKRLQCFRRPTVLHRSLQVALLLALVAAGCSNGTPDRQVISTPQAPAAIGPYSQAIRVGNTLYLAGQIGMDPETGNLVEGGTPAETRRAMQNLSAVLSAAGFGMDDVVQCQIFLQDLNDYGAMNEIYDTFFEEAPPARAVVQAVRIPRDARVEIMMVAVRGN